MSRSWREDNNEGLSQIKEHYRGMMEFTGEHGARMRMSLLLGSKHEIFSGKGALHLMCIRGKKSKCMCREKSQNNKAK